MQILDLTEEFSALVREARSTIEFKARFWTWLDKQRREGALAPLLLDMERHWSSVGQAPSLADARDILAQLDTGMYEQRVLKIGQRFKEITGVLPAIDVILLAGLQRPEGYSRFHRGKNTIFLGLDHVTALSYPDHLEIILAHELCHAVRDPDPEVLRDYGGSPEMTHDDFVSLHPLREHIVSEALATSISELCYPGRPQRRYIYFNQEDLLWCEQNRKAIVNRILLALERQEPYRTFYAQNVIVPGSPDCCDYWFGSYLGSFACRHISAGELLRMPAKQFLDRFLEPFISDFLKDLPVSGLSPSVISPADSQDAINVSLDCRDMKPGNPPAEVLAFYQDYQSLLREKPQLANELQQQLSQEILADGLRYGNAAWDIYAYPLVLSTNEEKVLRWSTEGLLKVIDQVIERYRTDPQVRAFFDFPVVLENLCLLEPGYRPHVMLGRFDSFWTGACLKFIELNVNGTAGWKLADALGKNALELPQLGELLKQHQAEFSSTTGRILDGILSAWRQVRGESAEPRCIAIVDWENLTTSSEQLLLARDFERMGVPTRLVPPGRLNFDGKILSDVHGPIDIVYRRLTALDILNHSDVLKPLFDAALTGAVVTVSSYASDIAHSKRLFAFLTHEYWKRMFTPAQQTLIDAHIPWTRMFCPQETEFEGQRWQLSELALAAQNRFVLKPAEGMEGREVLLGRETTPELWKKEVKSRYGRAYVLQEIIPAPVRPLIIPDKETCKEVARFFHLGEFVVSGQLAGFLARVSEELVLSRESNERSIPSLVLKNEMDEFVEQEFGPATP